MFRWSTFSRRLDVLLPPVEKDEDRARGHVFLVTLVTSLVLSAVSAVLAAGSALWVLAALNVVGTVVCALSLASFARHPEGAVRGYLWTFVVTLPLGAISTTPLELTTLCYLFLVPLVAATMLPVVEVKGWFFRAMAAGAAATIAAHFGLTVPQVDPLPLLTQLMNFAAALGASLALLTALSRDRERAVARLREAERAKSAFFANVGHEIRTPMNGVLGMTDALLARPLGGEEREMVQTIRSSGDVLLALIDDLLDLSKLEAGRLTLDETAHALAPLAAELEALWKPFAARKGLTLVVTCAPGLPHAARFDGRRVRQILGNLLSNALKFTERGSVTVVFAAHEEKLSFTVEDTGIGITAEQLQRLFGRFVQADDARARRYQGSGLGLSLSRELATRMGGTLEVSSTPGHGSLFACTLPLVVAELPAVQAEAERTLPPALRVLVVDDNAVNRLVAQRLLDKCGCLVEVASDGPSAVQAIARASFDVVLMDVQMPGMDGLEATRQLRQGAARMPIIGVSASAAAEDVEGCRRAGMNDFLAKPITRERLLETLLRNI